MAIQRVLVEALVVGIIFLMVAWPIMFGVRKLEFAENDKHDAYMVATVLSGMVAHFICEYSGINSWYCKNGHACMGK